MVWWRSDLWWFRSDFVWWASEEVGFGVDGIGMVWASDFLWCGEQERESERVRVKEMGEGLF